MPTATITIVNQSSRPYVYDEAAIRFLIYSDNGWRDQFPNGIADTHFISGVTVGSGRTYRTVVPLPRCEVLSDPCRQQVIIEYRAGLPGNLQTFRSPILHYEMRPDATATYEVDGLSGNLPLFMAYGIVRDRIVPDTLLVRFDTTQAELRGPFPRDPPLQLDLVQDFKRAGLNAETGGFGWGSPPYVDVRVHRYGQHRAAIEYVLGRVRQRYGSLITRYTEHLTYDLFNSFDAPGEDAIEHRASADATAKIQPVATVVGAGDIRFNTSLPYPMGRVRLSTAIFFFPGGKARGTQVDLFHPLELGTNADSPTPIVFSSEYIAAGKHPAVFDALQPAKTVVSQSAQSFDFGWLPALDQSAEIAADRPELYVIGVVLNAPEQKIGVLPEYAALQDAREKTQQLAEMLGVIPQFSSLFTLYPVQELRDGTAIGVATTFAGFDVERLLAPQSPLAITTTPETDPRVLAMLPIAAQNPSSLVEVTFTASATAQVDGNCDRLSGALLSAALHSDATQAVQIAQQTHRRLRKLLLAAAFPVQVAGNSCAPDANAGPPQVSAMLVFRTAYIK